MRQSRLMHSNNSGLTEHPRTVLILWWWKVGWVVVWGQWTGAGVTCWSLGYSVPWSLMGQHRGQCHCLSVMIF